MFPGQRSMIVKLLFWISAGVVWYVYAGYPLLLWFLQLFVRPSSRKSSLEPSVSLLVAAHNEAEVIGDKIRNGSLGKQRLPACAHVAQAAQAAIQLEQVDRLRRSRH